MDDLAGIAGVCHVFVYEVERGKETVQFGRTMKLQDELGIRLKVDIPEEAMPAFAALTLTGIKSLKPRKTLL